MAAKKTKARKSVASGARKAAKRVGAKVGAKVQRAGARAAKKASTTASAGVRLAKKTSGGLLAKIAQKSAQLILDSGILGEAPEPRKDPKRKAASRAGRAART